MEKDPAQRFANAQEMRQALNDYLAGRPVPGLGVHNDRTQVLGAGIPPMDGTAVIDVYKRQYQNQPHSRTATA